MKTPISLREVPAVLLMLAMAVLAAHSTTILSAFTITQGGGDSVLVNYIFEHDLRWATGQNPDSSLFSPPVFFPVRDTAGYSDLFVGAAPFYAIWRALGLPPQTAYQFFLITISALNFLSAYLLIRMALGTSLLASATAAFLFAFGSPRIMQIDHPQMFIAFYVVWAVAGIWWMFTGGRPGAWKGAALFAIALTLQFYTDFYYTWFLIFSAVLALGYALVQPALREGLFKFLRAQWLPLASAGAVVALAIAPAGVLYLHTVRTLGARSYTEATHYLPTALAWVAQGPLHWLYGPLDQALGIGENYRAQEMLDGIGFATLLLVVIGMVKFRWRPLIAICGAVSVLAVVLTLYWHGLSLWRFVYAAFPGASALRAVSRIGIFLLLPAAMSLAVCLDWLAQRVSPVAALLAVAAVVVEQAGAFHAPISYNKNQLQATMDSVARSAGPECQTVLFSWTNGVTSVPWMHLFGMWAGAFKGIPSLNGYSGQNPPGWPLIDVGISNRLDRLRLYDAIRSWMTSHPAEIGNVCWITPGSARADMLRPESAGESRKRRVFLALMGRLPSDNELRALPGAAFAAAVEHLPDFRDREQWVFAAYRSLLERDPAPQLWLAAVEDLAANRKTRQQLVEEWKKSDECRMLPACAGRSAAPELPRAEQEREQRVLLYYGLLQRAPDAEDRGDAALQAAMQ